MEGYIGTATEWAELEYQVTEHCALLKVKLKKDPTNFEVMAEYQRYCRLRDPLEMFSLRPEYLSNLRSLMRSWLVRPVIAHRQARTYQ
ncbi:MAG TPA: hypothetical protein VJJ22_04615 [Candidatus Paceibacterota bacterium]